ncbi:hypothetical protein N9W10_03180 [Gammaproteobacteria bacterium]|nr:hypothetical protein [Gammaproteobacteria bacterium]
MYNLNDHGFQVFSGIFQPSEIEEMRNKIQEAFQRLSSQDLILKNKSQHFNFQSMVPDVIQNELKQFKYIIFDERVLDCVRKLIGSDIVYFQDSTIQIGEGLTGYHKDNKTDNDPNHSDWKSNYDVIRMGVYFQNVKDFSGGINIKLGSHNHADYHSGKGINVPLETGDIVFWKLTTTHSGNAKRLKFFPEISLLGRVQRMLPEYFFIPAEMQRMALFATYGKPGVHLDSFINYFKSKSDTATRVNSSHCTDEARSLANSNGVSLMDVLQVN